MKKVKGNTYWFIAAICIAMALAGWSCKREAAPGSMDELFQGLAAARDFTQSREFYTGGTIAALERAAGERGLTLEHMGRVLPSFTGAQWELLDRKEAGDHATVTVRFTDHPVQNLIGFSARFSLVKEEGRWKIDLKDDVEKAVSPANKGGAAEYLRRLADGQ